MSSRLRSLIDAHLPAALALVVAGCPGTPGDGGDAGSEVENAFVLGVDDLDVDRPVIGEHCL